MTFLEKLDWLMQRDQLNKHTLAQQSGIPYTTIVGLYERGPENARLSTVNKLCSFFDVSLDYLAFDQYDMPEDFTPNRNTTVFACSNDEEIELLSLFRNLNTIAQETVLTTARAFAGNPSMQKEEPASRMA